jgi:hypothetical protein
MHFQSFTWFKTKRSLRVLFIWVYECANRPFPFVKFEPEVPNVGLQQRTSGSSPNSAGGGSLAVVGWCCGCAEPERTHGSPQHSQRWLAEAGPRAPVALLTAAPSAVPAGGERGRERARQGRQEERKVVLRSVEDKEACGWRNAGGHGARRWHPWWLHALYACVGADERGRNY